MCYNTWETKQDNNKSKSEEQWLSLAGTKRSLARLKSCASSDVGTSLDSSTRGPKNSRLRRIAIMDSSSFPLSPSVKVENQDNNIQSIFKIITCNGKVLALKIWSFLASQMFHTNAFTTRSPKSLLAGCMSDLQESHRTPIEGAGSGRCNKLEKWSQIWLTKQHCRNRWSTDSIPEWHMTQVAVRSLYCIFFS